MSIENIPGVERVQRLLKPHLDFPKGNPYRTIPKLDTIVCTHGARLPAVERLARDGFFSASDEFNNDFEGFFTSPNRKYKDWAKTDTGRELFAKIISYKANSDAVLRSIEYSDMAPDDETIYGNAFERIQFGAVIAFGKTALHPLAELREDVMVEDLELILPKAPEISDIVAIYPVDKFASDELNLRLRNLCK